MTNVSAVTTGHEAKDAMLIVTGMRVMEGNKVMAGAIATAGSNTLVARPNGGAIRFLIMITRCWPSLAFMYTWASRGAMRSLGRANTCQNI